MASILSWQTGASGHFRNIISITSLSSAFIYILVGLPSLFLEPILTFFCSLHLLPFSSHIYFIKESKEIF